MINVAHPYAADPSGPTLTVIEGSRGKPDVLTIRATELADLIDELTAAGMDMVSMAARLELAVANGRLDLVPTIAARLRQLGETYRDVATPGGAA